MDLAVTVGKDWSRELMRKRPMRRSLCKSRQDGMSVLAAEKIKRTDFRGKKILSGKLDMRIYRKRE